MANEYLIALSWIITLYNALVLGIDYNKGIDINKIIQNKIEAIIKTYLLKRR